MWILCEIESLRHGKPIVIDNKNTNRYRVVIKENDGTNTAYYFTTPMHPIWDDYTILQIIEAAATMVDIALTLAFTAPKVVSYLRVHKTANTIAKIFSFTANSIGSGFISASSDEFIEKAFEGTSLCWAYDIVSIYSSLNELVSDFDSGENYYRQVLEHCTNNLRYNIYVELQNSQKYQLTEISDLMANN